MKRILQVVLAAGFLGPCLPLSAQTEDPAARWLTLYGWIQTAERLGQADQWPLALGSYLEANRLLAALAETHPAFEPEMVAYRREALAKTIDDIETRLTTDEHETLMKYLDFIESLELGEAQRYRNEFEAALGTLGIAKALLDEISAQKPESFREAVAPQYARLESGISWLDSQVNFKARNRPATFVDDSVDWGTTRFVLASDLPAPSASAPVSLALFPAPIAALVTAAEAVEGTPLATPPAEPAATPASGAPADPTAPKRFRMSSRQAETPAPGAETPAVP